MLKRFHLGIALLPLSFSAPAFPMPPELSITVTGDLQGPSVNEPRYLEIPGQNDLRLLPHLIVGSDRRLFGRDAQNRFRELRLAPDGRLLDSLWREWGNPETREDLRIYLQAQGLEGEERVQAFLRRYRPEGTGEEAGKTWYHDSENPDFSLTVIDDEYLVKGGLPNALPVRGNRCFARPLGKGYLNGGKGEPCEYRFLTKRHCLLHPAAVFGKRTVNGSGYQYVEINVPGKAPLRISANQTRVFPPSPPTAFRQENSNKLPGDSVRLSFVHRCDWAKDSELILRWTSPAFAHLEKSPAKAPEKPRPEPPRNGEGLSPDVPKKPTGKPSNSAPAAKAPTVPAPKVPAVSPPARSRSSRLAPPQVNDFVRSNCQECHNGLKAPALPSFTADWDEWERRIRAADTTALTWLERFNAKVVHGEMLRLAGLKKTSGIGKDFRDFVARQHDRFLGRSREPSGGPLGSSDASFMIDPAKKREYLAALRSANLSDPEIRESLLRFDALWDATGAPLWSWAPKDGDAGRKGQRPVQWTTPAEPPRPHLFQQVDGVWNWKEPFFRGFSKDRHTRGLRSFLAIRFPRDPAGNLIKGILGTETRPRVTSPESSSGYAVKGQADDLDSLWASFPEGTRVFEVIYTTALGEPIAVDVLSRQKRISANGRIAHWVPDSHRHDSSPGKIREWVERQSDWRNDPELRSILDSVNHPVEDVVYSELGTDGTGGHPFLVKGRWTNALTGTKSVVPREAVSRETLLRMYRELPMESALGSPGWQLEPQRVFSRSHRGLPINSNTCANCHDSAGESFEDIFRRAGLDARSVSAYGNGPGYDSVLSAPWFRPEDLKDYGKRVWFDMRPEWAKFFEKYDEGNPKHSARRYRRTENLDVSDHPLRSR